MTDTALTTLVESFYDYLTDNQLIVFCLMFGYNDRGLTLSKKDLSDLLQVSQTTVDATYKALLDKLSQKTFRPLLDELNNYEIISY